MVRPQMSNEDRVLIKQLRIQGHRSKNLGVWSVYKRNFLGKIGNPAHWKTCCVKSITLGTAYANQEVEDQQRVVEQRGGHIEQFFKWWCKRCWTFININLVLFDQKWFKFVNCVVCCHVNPLFKNFDPEIIGGGVWPNLYISTKVGHPFLILLFFKLIANCKFLSNLREIRARSQK